MAGKNSEKATAIKSNNQIGKTTSRERIRPISESVWSFFAPVGRYLDTL